MENNILDQEQIDTFQPVKATFGERLVAYIIDSIIFIPFIALTFYNSFALKIIAIDLIAVFAFATYKIVMESVSGSTLGKRAMKIEIVNEKFEKVNSTNGVLRNVILLALAFYGAYTTVMLYNIPGYMEADTLIKLGEVTKGKTNQTLNIIISWGPILISGLWMVFDAKKQTLQDKIGKTYCIKRRPDYLKN